MSQKDYNVVTANLRQIYQISTEEIKRDTVSGFCNNRHLKKSSLTRPLYGIINMVIFS